MNASQVLRWLLRKTAPLPDFFLDSEQKTLRYVTEQRIAHRVARRLSESGQEANAPLLTNGLRTHCSQVEEKLTEHMNAVRELKEHLPSLDDIIFIKGFTNYAVTGRKENLREIADLDVLSHDPEALTVTLTQLGYSLAKLPSSHEFANYSREGVLIEIHKHFPCWCIPEILRASDLRPSHNPEVWVQQAELTRNQLEYKDVINHCSWVTVPGAGDLLLPDLNMALLMTCAQAFRDYTSFSSMYGRCRPRVRVGDLAEIYDLAQDTAFDEGYFVDLVKRFGGHDAIGWTNFVLEEYLGGSPLPQLTARPVERRGSFSARFPRHLWGDFVAAIEQPVEGIFEWGMPVGLVASKVGTNVVAANAQGRKYTVLQDGGGERLKRVIVKGGDAAPLPVELWAIADQRGLSVELSLQSAPGGLVDRVRVDFGNCALEWDRSTTDGSVVTREHWPCAMRHLKGRTAIAETTMVERSDSYRLSLKFPWEMVADVPRDSGRLPALVGVGRLREGPELLSGTLIPVSFLLS